MITCVVLAVIAIALYLICFANSRDVVPRTAGAISFRQTFTMLRRNRPLQILLLTALLFLTSNSVFNPVGLYYVRAITGNAGYFAFLQLAQTLGMIFFASFAPAITRRYGKRNGCMLAALVSVLFYRLDGATHLQVVEELTERRTQHAIAGAKGVDVERTQVGEAGLGDGRTRLMRRPGTPNPPIVTIFGQRGSGATEISPMVAELLQVPYIGQKFSSQTLAQADRTTLVSDSAFNRWMRNRSHSGSRNTDMAVALDTAPNHQIAEENTKSVLADAENGAVLLGRNGALVLGPVVGTLHVRLIAPLDKRIERVMHKTGLSASEAAEQCEIEDRLRAEMSRKLYKWDPNVDEEYDLVINTASTTYKQVAELIVEMYRSKYPENVPPRNQTGD